MSLLLGKARKSPLALRDAATPEANTVYLCLNYPSPAVCAVFHSLMQPDHMDVGMYKWRGGSNLAKYETSVLCWLRMWGVGVSLRGWSTTCSGVTLQVHPTS